MKSFWLILYYGLLQFLPMQPFPGYKLFYKLRYYVVKRILKKCGKNVIVKSKCYFGDGSRLEIGDNSQLGQNARLGGKIKLGNNILMGPDVVMMAVSHRYDRIDIPIQEQGEFEKEIVIGDNTWIGTRVIILPGVKIGKNCIIGAGSVVTKSFGDNLIIAGNPARIIREREGND